MGFFDDICNRHWCEELMCACGTNVVVFTADGFTFFGLLDRMEDGILILLPAAGEDSIIVITAGGEEDDEDLSFIDVCTIVAISKNVQENPFAVEEASKA